MPLLVLKFGGTSVGTCDKIIKVAKLVKKYYDQKNKVIVVSSAMSGATDDLIKKSKKISNVKMLNDVLLYVFNSNRIKFM